MASNKKAPMESNKKPPKRPASHQRQIAANKARDKKSTELGGILGKMGITRVDPKKSGESEFEYIKRGLLPRGGTKDIKKAIGGATKTVKKVVKKFNG